MESIWVFSVPGGCGPRLDLRGRGWQPRGMGDEAISVRPANEAGWDELRAVFGSRGQGAVCFCQRYKLPPGEAFKHVPAAERAARLRDQAGCGREGPTSGLVAYRGAEPIGWCAVEPRVAYPGLLRVYRVPWAGRREDKADPGVWAVTCFFVRAGFRRQGVSAALARAAVDFARAGGARALEGYPMLTAPGQEVAWGEMSVGARSVFAAAGFREVSHPSARRVVMRIELQVAGDRAEDP
jgi:GNAT superfamily N-acetyltransferase